MEKHKLTKEEKTIADIISSMAEEGHAKPQRVYVNVNYSVYDGDTGDGHTISVTLEKERARSKYLNAAHEYERHFLNTFCENAIINRDDDAMFCECFSETEDYCRYHAVAYVKTFEL